MDPHGARRNRHERRLATQSESVRIGSPNCREEPGRHSVRFSLRSAISGSTSARGRAHRFRDASITRDPRGQHGELVVQEQAITLSPNFARWRDAARQLG